MACRPEQSLAGCRAVWPLCLAACSGRRRDHGEPRSSWVVRSSSGQQPRPGRESARPHTQDTSRVLSPGGVDALMAAATAPGSGHVRSDGPRGPPPLGGARPATGQRQCRRASGVHSPGQGRTPRIVPLSARFFAGLGRYIDDERTPTAATDRVFVVLKGPRRGQPQRPPGWTRSWTGPRPGLVSPRRPATSCATPASPACGRPAWPSMPSRPRPVMPPSN